MQSRGSARGEAAAAAQGQQPETCLAVFSLLRFTRLVSHLASRPHGRRKISATSSTPPPPSPPFPPSLRLPFLISIPTCLFIAFGSVTACATACVTFIGARWRPRRHVGVWNMLASWCMSPSLLWLFSVALENRAPLLFFLFLLKDLFFFFIPPYL